MAALDYWNQLSTSSKHALHWAGALARIRAEQAGNDVSSALADSYDLLVGMMLEHPHDSEPTVLLRHFGLVPGNVLPMDYPRPSEKVLERHLAAIPGNEAPPLNPEDAASIVSEGINIGMSSGSPKVAELRALFAAMLEVPNTVADKLSDLLHRRGTDLTAVKDTTVDFVKNYDSSKSYAAVLSEHHHYSPEPINIANYKADHRQDADLAHDLINIRAEVDAFAYLLTSCDLRPPMAVGLFGDWGSGKSFFMEAVRQRIDQLISDPNIHKKPQSQTPFWKRVVQIRFNAWHYVEGELWASLVNHIFCQLRLVFDGDNEGLVEQRRKYWLEKLGSARVQLAQLETERIDAEHQLQNTQQKAEDLRRKRDDEIKKIEKAKSESVALEVLQPSSVKAVQDVLGPIFSLGGEKSAVVALERLEEARTEFRRTRTLVESLWERPAHLVLVIALLIAIPTGVWFLSWLDVSTITTAFAGLSAAVGGGLGLLHRANTLMQDQLDKIEAAEKDVLKDFETARAKWEKEIKKAETATQEVEDELSAVLDQKEELTEELTNIEAQIERVSPTYVLNEFVTERAGSGVYRKRLGIPALIQNDFDKLAGLIREQNEELLKKDATDSEKDENSFNRIILYIDDLDRCPEEHVIGVLQAVHLLLAFDLFVVVVAVDSRWLNHALVKHFPALANESTNSNHATPDDYLEKIFQVPFWVEPLNDDARRSIVHGLLRGHITSVPIAPSPDGSGDKPEVGDPQRKILTTLDPTSAPPVLDTAALTLTADELRFLDELAPLLGETPRSVKRFVNLYQLLRIIQRSRPLNVQGCQQPIEQLMAFALAVGNGLTDIGPRFMKQLRKANAGQSLQDVLVTVPQNSDGINPQRERLDEWLASHQDWQQIPASCLSPVISAVERFLFRVGRT